MIVHYQAAGFSVIQLIYSDNNKRFIKDYIGRVFDYDDVTDDGEVFDPLVGWIKMFFLDEDIQVIRSQGV